MEIITREVEDLDKMDPFVIQEHAHSTANTVGQHPLLCSSSASSSAEDLIFSSRDTWKRLPRVCSPHGLLSG